MADGVALNPASGGDTIAADDIGGQKYQRVKVTFGEDGSSTDASLTDPFPIRASTLPLPTGAASQTTLALVKSVLDDILTELASGGGTTVDVTDRVGRLLGHATVDNFPASQAVTGPLTDGQLRASAVPVSAASLPLPSGAATDATLALVKTAVDAVFARLADGSAHTIVDSSALPSGAATETTLADAEADLDTIVTQQTDGSQKTQVTNFPASQAVTGPLTDAQLRAAVVPIGDGGGSITVDGTVTANVGTTNGIALDATVGKRFTGGKNTSATTISTNGDNNVYSPAAGKTLTLFWVFLSSSQDNGAEVLATVKLGTKVVYKAYMGNPGAFSHWEPVTADNPDDKLVVNLSAGGNSVAVSYSTTEV